MSYSYDERVWHFEMPNLQALCKPVSPLMDSGIPAANTTPNPKYVTCCKCLQLLKKQNIKEK